MNAAHCPQILTPSPGKRRNRKSEVLGLDFSGNPNLPGTDQEIFNSFVTILVCAATVRAFSG